MKISKIDQLTLWFDWL